MILASVAVLAGCGEESSPTPPAESGGEPESSESSAKPPSSSDALSQMEIAFEGNPSQAEVQADLDKAFRLYGVPVTEENYSRAGELPRRAAQGDRRARDGDP